MQEYCIICKIYYIAYNMKAKNKMLLTHNKQLGSAMKRIRESRKVSTLFVAKKLGYETESTYCRMEHGTIMNISVWTLLEFCKLFECNIFHLFVLAEIDIFDTKIKTWTEFYQSLSNLPTDEASKLLALANKIPHQKPEL